MSVVLGLAVANLAPVAADMRLNLQFRDGNAGIHDAGTIDFTYPDGRVLRVGDNYRKVRQAATDRACGAGFLLPREGGEIAMASTTGDLAYLRATLRRAADRTPGLDDASPRPLN